MNRRKRERHHHCRPYEHRGKDKFRKILDRNYEYSDKYWQTRNRTDEQKRSYFGNAAPSRRTYPPPLPVKLPSTEAGEGADPPDGGRAAGGSSSTFILTTSNEKFLVHPALQEPAHRVLSRSTANPQSRVEAKEREGPADEAVRIRTLNGTERPASGPNARLSSTTDSTTCPRRSACTCVA